MLEIGSVIGGKYKILNVIGRGGMSVVYLARDEKVNRQWAIKEISKKANRDFSLDKKEIEMMKKLNHPNLPGIVDVIESGETLLIVMDYIEGQSLEDIFEEQGAQPPELVIEWGIQLCDALGYLHSQTPPIIYRDMKPANVMLKPDGNVVLIDFGAAREYKPEKIKDTIAFGTIGYAAPEQYSETDQSDARTDIYCLGVLMFQLLTGKNPHDLQPIRDIDPSLSSGLEAIVQKCTQVNKEDRYQAAAELRYALEHFWEFDVMYRKEQKKKLTFFFVPAILSVVLFIGAIVFAVLERGSRNSTYDAYMLAAQNAIGKAEEIDNFEKAINLNPTDERAYIGLLEDGLLDDNVLTTEESETLRSILINCSDGKRTNEQRFRDNESGYAEFAYDAGVAYFYKFEEKANKKNAKGYFETAANSKKLEKQQIDRAKRLYTISDYYSNIGIVDAAGDATITYRDYWDDLVELSQGNLVAQDNERTAIVMYEELVGQIISRAAEFKKDGVRKEEMLNELDKVRKHLQTDFGNGSEKSSESVQQDIEDLLEYIGKAEKMVESAYGKAKEGSTNG